MIALGAKRSAAEATRATLRWSDILWTLLPAITWLIAIYARGVVIRPRCALQPDSCQVSTLLSMDRPAVGLEIPGADGLSFTTQGLSAVVALSIPALWQLGSVILGTATPLGALMAAGADLVVFAQTTAWNGLLTESAHLISQRPRPFVYADPGRARDFSNYTSFYSGHTSFSAAATSYVFFTLMGHGAPAWILVLAGALAYALMSLTGLYRVLAGRHFPTDVLFGALAGMAVAYVVARRHWPKLRLRRPS